MEDNISDDDDDDFDDDEELDENALRRRLEAFRQRAANERARRRAAEAQIAEREREIAMRDREIAERDRVIAERDEALEEAWQLREGTYFSTLTQVFGIESVPFAQADFDVLLRQRCPQIHVTIDRNDSYRQTDLAATNFNNLPANEPDASRSSIGATDRRFFWPFDIFRNPDPRADLAHLIPAAAAHASTYDHVVMLAMSLTQQRLQALLGRPPTPEEFWAAKQRAIHGARRLIGGNRIGHSGLKHSPLNKIRLSRQRDFLDNSESVIVIPIMSLDEMLRWNGQGYDAIVMVEAGVGETLEVVCGRIGMTNNGLHADEEEIELARQLLRNVLRGLAFSFMQRERPLQAAFGTLSAHGSHAINVLGEVTVPVMAANGHVHRVRKVSFGVPGEHAAPDPFLLVVKAAVVWSKRHQQQLLAGGEVEDDIDSFSCEAEERYAEWLEECYRPKNLEGLAVGLGQPEEYCSSDVSMDSNLCSNDDDSRDANPAPKTVVKSEFD